ncbi:MAG: hypothetical protein H6838_06655 [Planctomycetes bacterium]|nr:hypothetical protein [Planctomycetota bacterium]
MRYPLLAMGLALGGCATGPTPVPEQPRPEVAVVRALDPGAVLVTECTGLPDELPWRAAAVLWHEALRQSVQFVVLEDAGGAPGRDRLRLSADPTSQRLAALLVDAHGQTVPIGGDTAADGDLAAAIDRLARTAREALGEVTTTPVPTAACVGRDPSFVDAAADAHRLLHDGAIESAFRLFTRCRARDGGSPYVLDGLAEAELLRGHPGIAERIAQEALGFSTRLAPHRQHRIARTLLLARASQRPENAPERDRQLRDLGRVFHRERPHDPEALLTMGLAENFLGEFAAARPHLQAFVALEPDHPLGHYHLGWTQLALGEHAAAVAEFETAALRLPPASLIVPRSIALYGAGQHERLQQVLADLATELLERDSLQLHDLRRMQAAHALLRGDDAAAVELLRQDFTWLVSHPSALDERVGEFAEAGVVLVRLGGARALPPILAALQQQRPGTALADAISFLSGVVTVAETNQRAEAVERQLSRGGESVFALLLQALCHERRGELGDQYTALARAARMSDSPLTKMLLARSLTSMGRQQESDQLLAALRSEMLRIRLRQRAQHPLLGPELAYAFR